jgi:hypothetical protein
MCAALCVDLQQIEEEVSCTWSWDLGQSCNADIDVPPVHLQGFGSFLCPDASPVLLPQSFIA